MAENTERVRIPSSIKLHGDLAVVQVDQWGSQGEYHRGDIVKLSELDSSQYDGEWAVKMGTLRMLTEAEAVSPPTTRVLDQNGEPDESHTRMMRYHAGFPDEVEAVQAERKAQAGEPTSVAASAETQEHVSQEHTARSRRG